MKRFALFTLVFCMIEFTISAYNEGNIIYWLILSLVNSVCVGCLFALDRMTKEEKIHLEGAKAYGPQDYEVVDELKKLKEENEELKEWAEENSYLRAELRKAEGELEIVKKERDEYKKRWERGFSV